MSGRLNRYRVDRNGVTHLDNDIGYLCKSEDVAEMEANRDGWKARVRELERFNDKHKERIKELEAEVERLEGKPLDCWGDNVRVLFINWSSEVLRSIATHKEKEETEND